MLLVQHADHFAPLYLKSCAGGDCSGGRQSKPNYSSDGLFSNEVACREESDRSFFTVFGNNRQLCSALLEIENRVSGISLRKKSMLRLQLDDPSSKSGVRQKCSSVKSICSEVSHPLVSFSKAIRA